MYMYNLHYWIYTLNVIRPFCEVEKLSAVVIVKPEQIKSNDLHILENIFCCAS